MSGWLKTIPGRVVSAVGPLPAGAVLVCVPAVLVNYGPMPFASDWFGILYFPLRYGAALFAAFLSFKYRPPFLNLVMFCATFLGLFAFPAAIEGAALRERGRVTACEIVAVRERNQVNPDGNGNIDVTTHYDHTLRCADPRVTALTTTISASRGHRDVLFDPTGRTDPRWASDSIDPALLLWIGAGVLVASAAHRLAGEFIPEAVQ
ncbi:hypothetical protein GCM10007977_028670 [Dactylosporangium sucinum]|uniref:Uncharacterized protein n=2 Tax=Dactylosporangium sucinum TaxID=1424081 RepID=A0A917TJQ9_9ACTN|nr:hypothetical protein GCM10007977_028670 [Dactylosporangium sucinum]